MELGVLGLTWIGVEMAQILGSGRANRLPNFIVSFAIALVAMAAYVKGIERRPLFRNWGGTRRAGPIVLLLGLLVGGAVLTVADLAVKTWPDPSLPVGIGIFTSFGFMALFQPPREFAGEPSRS